MEKSKILHLAATFFCIIAALLLLYLLFEYALGIILPFAIAFFIGAPIYFLSLRINKAIKVPRKLCAAVLVLLFFGALALVVFLSVNRLFLELEELIEWLRSDGDGVRAAVGSVFGYLENFSSRIPFIEEIETIKGLEDMRTMIDESISKLLSELITKLATILPEWVIRVVRYTPKALITTLVTLIASFYFAMDYGRIRGGIIGILPKRAGERVSAMLTSIGKALKSYAKAYLFIMLITFCSVFAGLLIMRRRYAFILAFLIAVVDILPIFGAGTVLIPWAVFELITKDTRAGLGLLILYGVVTIIRQIAEPKIVGESLGIHPLATLFAMFAGLKLFGFAGMILAPSMVMIAKEIVGQEKTRAK